MITLYSKQGDKLRQWQCFAQGAEVVVIHGQVGGKQTEKRYTAEPKNHGKANATTAEQQALLEVEAKVTKQLKSGYSKTKEEAEFFVPFFPMKAQNYLDYAHKVKYPCYIQPKLDGQRLMIDKDGNAWSKQGEPLELPEHWVGVRDFAVACGGLDGEIYAGRLSEGGLSLQEIISAFRKANDNTPKLKYYVYDVPDSASDFEKRKDIIHHTPNIPNCVAVVSTRTIESEEEGNSYFDYCVGSGFEGVVYRNAEGVYEFDKRSYNLIKRKKREDAEARILSVESDKNGDGVVTAELVNGANIGNVFKCLFRKDAHDSFNLRKYAVVKDFVGGTFTVEFEAYSDDGVPLKPVGKCLRKVDENGNPLI